MPSKKAGRQQLWEKLTNKQDPEPPRCPKFFDDTDFPPMITRGISADEYSREEGSDKQHFSSDEESNNGTGPPRMLTCGISADEYSSEEGSDKQHFSSDEESNNGTGPPRMLTRGISADEYSSEEGSDEDRFIFFSDEESSADGSSSSKKKKESGEEVCGSCDNDDSSFFFGSGQPMMTFIRPARLSEISELTDDAVGEQAVV
jgi:hypothetical protein